MSPMDDLAQWLGAQLDVDAARAEACPGNGEWDMEGIGFYAPDLSPQVREHMVEHDPARVLREIDVDRELLGEYERLLRAHQAHEREVARMAEAKEDDPIQLAALRREADYLPAMLHVVERWAKRKAVVYADRPGYHEEWRP